MVPSLDCRIVPTRAGGGGCVREVRAHERVPDRYLAMLRDVGVSYVFGGRDEIDVKRVLRSLTKRFGITRLLLEGGGKINGSFLHANVVDELSLLVAPVVDGSTGTPALFDRAPAKARAFELVSVTKRPHDLVWLRYRRAHRAS